MPIYRPILFILGLLLTFSAHAEKGGGGDHGGLLPETTVEEVAEAVKLVDQLLSDEGTTYALLEKLRIKNQRGSMRIAPQFRNVFGRDIDPFINGDATSDLISNIYLERFKRGPRGTARKSTFIVQPTGPCLVPYEKGSNASKHHYDASVEEQKPDTNICFSAERLAKKITPDALFVEVLALALHELVHAYGGNEAEADVLQRHVRRNYSSLKTHVDIFNFCHPQLGSGHMSAPSFIRMYELVLESQRLTIEFLFYSMLLDANRIDEAKYVLSHMISRTQVMVDELKLIQMASIEVPASSITQGELEGSVSLSSFYNKWGMQSIFDLGVETRAPLYFQSVAVRGRVAKYHLPENLIHGNGSVFPNVVAGLSVILKKITELKSDSLEDIKAKSLFVRGKLFSNLGNLKAGFKSHDSYWRNVGKALENQCPQSASSSKGYDSSHFNNREPVMNDFGRGRKKD